MSGENSIQYYDPNCPIKQETPEYYLLVSQQNPICSPYYNDDPFAVLPNSPEYHPQSQNSSSQCVTSQIMTRQIEKGNKVGLAKISAHGPKRKGGKPHYKTAASTQTPLISSSCARILERERERSACEENRKEKTQGLGNHPTPPFQRIATEIGPVEVKEEKVVRWREVNPTSEVTRERGLTQWMDAGPDFSNWNTTAQPVQGNEAQSSQIQSSEEDPSKNSHYQTASKNPNDYPFNNPISNSSDYQSYHSGSPVMYHPYVF
ncbi:hypothetical protein L1987_37887 [Smallanthus sonchifolius]|uniref:Uncharacterized protein n=1 Tax=Smallanthus sonchifolius TaxID=185202 RepID=A0ACB9HII0_9ASTR|nr:hypothetical protein L1987_37887 [Smallanthus sonchifolius]